MKTFLFLIFGLFCTFSSYSQFSFSRLDSYSQIRANALMKDLEEALPSDVKYSKNTFTDGTVYYVSGKRSGLKLNYSFLYHNVSIIQNGDTLLLAPDPTITYVRIGKDFYLHNGDHTYLKMVNYKDNQEVKLIASYYLTINKYVNTEMTGYGSYQHTRHKDQLHSYYDSIRSPFFYQNEIVATNKKIYYYLLDNNDQVFAANRAGFIRAFPKYSLQIEGYLLQMARQGLRIKFYKKADVIKLYDFCIGLRSINI